MPRSQGEIMDHRKNDLLKMTPDIRHLKTSDKTIFITDPTACLHDDLNKGKVTLF